MRLYWGPILIGAAAAFGVGSILAIPITAFLPDGAGLVALVLSAALALLVGTLGGVLAVAVKES